MYILPLSAKLIFPQPFMNNERGGLPHKLYFEPFTRRPMEEREEKVEVFHGTNILPNDYFQVRFDILRKPLGFELGSERLDDDGIALHSMVQVGQKVVSVGRAHLIEANSDGGQSDHSGPDAATCPGFTPLLGESGFPAVEKLRPAFQIRQMGTLEKWQRKGYAAKVLQALESQAVSEWGCSSGWLQAREEAIPFYQKAGWKCFGGEYDISGIGLHTSMWKLFS